MKTQKTLQIHHWDRTSLKKSQNIRNFKAMPLTLQVGEFVQMMQNTKNEW